MKLDLVSRLIEGVRAGSLVLTRTEATIYMMEMQPNSTVMVDGRRVNIRNLPLHVLPDEPSQLPEVETWWQQVHDVLVDEAVHDRDRDA